MTIRTSALALLLLSATVAGAADWPQWRGPDRSGVSGETGLLKAWPKDGPKLLWTFKKAGIAHSSFAVVADTLYTLGTRGDSELVIALDAKKGEEKWSVKIGPIFDATGNWGHGPRSTPTVDGDRLYALGSDGDLVCVDLGAKKEIWRKNLPKDFGGEMMTDWGYGESPLIDGDTLICTPGGAKGTLLALNKKDGAVLWQSADLKNKAPYSSAVAATIHGVRVYVQNSFTDSTDGGYISGFRAKDGKVLWTSQTFKLDSYDIGPTPVVRDNLVYATTYNPVTGCHLFEIGKDFKPRDLYSKKNQKVMKNNHGGVVVVGDFVYGHSGGGWVCQEFKSGDQKWYERNRLSCKSGAITAAEGLLYLFTEDGEVALVEANPDAFTERSSFLLPERSMLQKTVKTAEESRPWAHPVIANGRLYLRDHELIFCYDVKGK